MSESVNKQQIESAYSRYKNMADDAVSLQILEIITHKKETSQRKITRETGLATGLVHSYLNRVISKGWVKANQVSAKRWLYYLTPEGFLEKSRLTIKYLSVTLDSYRSTQAIITDALDHCALNGWRRLVVAGTDHLAEILILNIKASAELELVGIVAPDDKKASGIAAKSVPFDHIHSLNYDRILVSDSTFIDYCRDRDKNGDLLESLIHLNSNGAKKSK